MPVFEFRGAIYNNPVELALDVVGGKWKMPILWRLHARTFRYNELRRDLGRISAKVLTQQLRELERDGLVHREVFAEIPPRVEYSITDIGRTVVPVIEELRLWGRQYREAAPGSPAAPDSTPARDRES